MEWVKKNYKYIAIAIAALLLAGFAGYVYGIRTAGRAEDGVGTEEYLNRAISEGAESRELNKQISAENKRGSAAIDRASAAVSNAQESADRISDGISTSQGKLSEAASLNREAGEELRGAEQILNGLIGEHQEGQSQSPAR